MRFKDSDPYNAVIFLFYVLHYRQIFYLRRFQLVNLYQLFRISLWYLRLWVSNVVPEVFQVFADLGGVSSLEYLLVTGSKVVSERSRVIVRVHVQNYSFDVRQILQIESEITFNKRIDYSVNGWIGILLSEYIKIIYVWTVPYISI